MEFSLFTLAPPLLALHMMENGLIKDLNEQNDKGVSLLALKSKGAQINTFLPLWSEWEKDSQNIWKDVSATPNIQHLVASMIFAGADPWVEWQAESYDNKNKNLFSYAVFSGNVPLVKFLLSHPNCPTAEVLDTYEIEKMSLKTDTYRHVGEENVKLLHVAANGDNLEMVELLVNKGMSFEQLDNNGRTPLFYTLKSEIAKFLIEKGASISVIDKKQHNVGIYWRKNFPTAARQSEFNKILIDRMKKSMTIEEVQEIQKPALFLEMATGTKTNFESIFKKSKFPPNVLMPAGSGAPDLLTYALLRNDDKKEMFVSWCLDKKISLTREIWEGHPELNNALVSFIGGQSGVPSQNVFKDILKERYANKKSALTNDLLSLCNHMLDAEFKVNQVLTFLTNFAVAKKESQSSSQLYYEYHSFSKTAKYMDMVTDDKFVAPAANVRHSQQDIDRAAFALLDDIMTRPEFRSTFHKALKGKVKKLKLDKYQQASGSLKFLEQLFHADIKNGETNPLPLLWLMLHNYFVSTEKNPYNNQADALSAVRIETMGILKSADQSIIVDQDEVAGIIKELQRIPQDKKDLNPSLSAFSSILSAISINQALSHVASNKKAPTHRRM